MGKCVMTKINTNYFGAVVLGFENKRGEYFNSLIYTAARFCMVFPKTSNLNVF